MATEILSSPHKEKPSLYEEDQQIKETNEMLSNSNSVEEKIRKLGLSEDNEILSTEGCIKAPLTEDQGPGAAEESAVSNLPETPAEVELGIVEDHYVAEDIEDSNEFYEVMGDGCCVDAAGSTTATDYESCEENESEEDEGLDLKAEDLLGESEDKDNEVTASRNDDSVLETAEDIKVFSQEDEDNAFCMQDSKDEVSSIECADTKVGRCKESDENETSVADETVELDSGSDTADDDGVFFKAEMAQDNDQSLKSLLEKEMGNQDLSESDAEDDSEN